MNHEPECFYTGVRDDTEWRDAEDEPCICDAIQMAYARGVKGRRLEVLDALGRGYGEGYSEGRADAERAVWLELSRHFGDFGGDSFTAALLKAAREGEGCLHEDTWFDRTVCPEPCGSMHTICSTCGYIIDDCPLNKDAE